MSFRPVAMVALEHGDSNEEVDNQRYPTHNRESRIRVEVANLHNTNTPTTQHHPHPRPV